MVSGMWCISSMMCGFIFSDSRKNSSTAWPANNSLNGKPAKMDPTARMPIGISIVQRRFVRGLIVLLIVRLAMEGLEDQAP